MSIFIKNKDRYTFSKHQFENPYRDRNGLAVKFAMGVLYLVIFFIIVFGVFLASELIFPRKEKSNSITQIKSWVISQAPTGAWSGMSKDRYNSMVSCSEAPCFNFFDAGSVTVGRGYSTLESRSAKQLESASGSGDADTKSQVTKPLGIEI